MNLSMARKSCLILFCTKRIFILIFFLHVKIGDEAESGSIRQRKKKSRWGGSESDKTFIPGMPTVLPPSLDSHQQEAYLGKYNNAFYILFLVIEI